MNSKPSISIMNFLKKPFHQISMVGGLCILIALWALAAGGAIVCPGKPSGLTFWVQPAPPCQDYPDGDKFCSINQLDDPDLHLGLCVSSEESKRCEDGNGRLSAKKYWGGCAGQYQCTNTLVGGEKIFIENNATTSDWSKATGDCGG
jgi:hypothetical protein